MTPLINTISPIKGLGGLLTINGTGFGSDSSIFFKVQTKYMVGLSATPERKDGLSRVIYWFLGPQIVFIKRETGKPRIKFVINDISQLKLRRETTEKHFGRNSSIFLEIFQNKVKYIGF